MDAPTPVVSTGNPISDLDKPETAALLNECFDLAHFMNEKVNGDLKGKSRKDVMNYFKEHPRCETLRDNYVQVWDLAIRGDLYTNNGPTSELVSLFQQHWKSPNDTKELKKAFIDMRSRWAARINDSKIVGVSTIDPAKD